MRLIEKMMVNAIKNKKNWSSGNTTVSCIDCVIVVRFHGNKIAEIDPHKSLTISSCGYRTKTTKSRLNAILDLFNISTIYQKDFVWYSEQGEFTDGEVYHIS